VVAVLVGRRDEQDEPAPRSIAAATFGQVRSASRRSLGHCSSLSQFRVGGKLRKLLRQLETVGLRF